MKTKHLTTTRVNHFKLYLLKAAAFLSVNSTVFTESDFYKSACGASTVEDLECIDLSAGVLVYIPISVTDRLEIVKFVDELIKALKECEAKEADNGYALGSSANILQNDAILERLLYTFQCGLIADNMTDFSVTSMNIQAFNFLIITLESTISNYSGNENLTDDQIAELKEALSLEKSRGIGSFSSSELTKAYYKFASKNHPDKNNGDTEKAELFKKIKGYYDIAKAEVEKTLTPKSIEETKSAVIATALEMYPDIYVGLYNQLMTQRFPYFVDIMLKASLKRDESAIQDFYENILQASSTDAIKAKIKTNLPSLEKRAENQKMAELFMMLEYMLISVPINLSLLTICYTYGANYRCVTDLSVLGNSGLQSTALWLGVGSYLAVLLGSSAYNSAKAEEPIVYAPSYKELFFTTTMQAWCSLGAVLLISELRYSYNLAQQNGILRSIIVPENWGSILHPTSTSAVFKLILLSAACCIAALKIADNQYKHINAVSGSEIQIEAQERAQKATI